MDKLSRVFNLCLISLFVITVCCQKNTTEVLGPGYCRHRDDEIFCCSNYYIVEDKCVECQAGYFRLTGDYCVGCDKGYFGRFCALSCDCKQEQICDSVQGCICPNHQEGCYKDTVETTISENITGNIHNNHSNGAGYPFSYWLMIVSPVIVVIIAGIIIIIRTIKGRSENLTPPEQREHNSNTVDYSYTDFNDNSRHDDIEPGQLAQSAFNNLSSLSLDESEWSVVTSNDSDVYVNLNGVL